MKCISLWQPWASAIACELKRIETRSWRPPEHLNRSLTQEETCQCFSKE